MIENMYNQSAVTHRETAVGMSTIKKAYTLHLSAFSCHIQPLDPSLTQMIPGSFGKHWVMFCPIADIAEGDKVIVDSTDEYRVTGVETFDFGQNQHMEVVIKAFRE